jgi:polysaccharide export outer membrane protein
MAGGLTDKETGIAVIIRKYKDNTNGSLKIELDRLMMGEDAKLNIPLMAGDILNIPPKRVVSVYIFGQVKAPGEIKVSRDGNPTLLKAIATAGGFTTRARRRSVLIKRVVNGKEIKFRVNALRVLNGKDKNFVLKKNDIIHVPESIL